jgi:hypothetical protein
VRKVTRFLLAAGLNGTRRLSSGFKVLSAFFALIGPLRVASDSLIFMIFSKVKLNAIHLRIAGSVIKVSHRKPDRRVGC